MYPLAKTHHYVYGPGILPPWASWLAALGLIALIIVTAYWIIRQAGK